MLRLFIEFIRVFLVTLFLGVTFVRAVDDGKTGRSGASSISSQVDQSIRTCKNSISSCPHKVKKVAYDIFSLLAAIPDDQSYESIVKEGENFSKITNEQLKNYSDNTRAAVNKCMGEMVSKIVPGFNIFESFDEIDGQRKDYVSGERTKEVKRVISLSLMELMKIE